MADCTAKALSWCALDHLLERPHFSLLLWAVALARVIVGLSIFSAALVQCCSLVQSLSVIVEGQPPS